MVHYTAGIGIKALPYLTCSSSAFFPYLILCLDILDILIMHTISCSMVDFYSKITKTDSLA